MKRDQGRDTVNSQGTKEVGFLIGINFPNLNLTGVFLAKSFDGRIESSAGSTPGSLEVNDHRARGAV